MRVVDKALQSIWCEEIQEGPREPHSPQVLSGFKAAAPSIFNIEPDAEPEKPLKVDLNLYQLENFEL